MKKVSIIVPVYGVESYLRQCVDSILAQTYQNIQVILVDDGSPDNCGPICDEYAAQDDRILTLHKENGGVSNARNYGMEYADGRYITFCDADDSYTPDWIWRLVERMELEHPDVVVGGFTLMAENGTMGSSNRHDMGVWKTDSETAKMQYCFSMVLQPRHGGEIWDRLFRLDIIKNNQIRFCESCGNYAEDLGFVLHYSMYTNMVSAIDSCGYCYRIRSGSMMQTSVDVPKLESMHQVFLSLEPICRCVFGSETAEWMLPRLYTQMIGMLFMSKVWSSSIEPAEMRKKAIAGVKDWNDMEKRLKSCIRYKYGWNPWYSGSYNAEINCHISYLLGGSWLMLRIQCKLIRMFYSLINALGGIRKRIDGID